VLFEEEDQPATFQLLLLGSHSVGKYSIIRTVVCIYVCTYNCPPLERLPSGSGKWEMVILKERWQHQVENISCGLSGRGLKHEGVSQRGSAVCVCEYLVTVCECLLLHCHGSKCLVHDMYSMCRYVCYESLIFVKVSFLAF